MMTSSNLKEQPTSAKTGGELVPFGMSERERAILEEFYR